MKMNKALLNIVIGTNLNRTDISRLLCRDIVIGKDVLEIHYKRKKHIITDFSIRFPIIEYYRERIRKMSPNDKLFPYERQSISIHFKKMTGKTIREYRKCCPTSK